MLEALTELMAAATGRCAYADARRVVRSTRRLIARNGRVEQVETTETDGIGVRTLVGGGWGFAATNDLSKAGAERALARALAIAAAQPAAPAAALASVAPARGHWASPCEQDPFAVAIEDQCALLAAADAALRIDARIVHSEAHAMAVRTEKAFASTDGAACTQVFTETGGGIFATAVDGDEHQQRSYPGQFEGNAAAAGWDYVLDLDLLGNAPRVAEEALELLSAPDCPAMDTTVVLGGEQLALQIHESIGHALELDRILGGEVSYAGTSWVRPDDIGTLRYGSELLNITADATLPAALGSFAWDDEGVPGQSLRLIRDGVLRTALSSRETAAVVGLESSGGCMRAEDWSRQPIVRMTNVSIEPGEAGTLADLIADTDEGIFLDTNRSWSIDDRRLHFQFATEVAREIKGGQLGRLYRNASYAGITPHFWGSLDAVCSASEWRLWSTLNCGKGEPGQSMHVSHGTVPARFRGVQVGIG